MTLTFILSVDSLTKPWLTASAEPCTSALTITLSVLTSPLSILLNISSNLAACCFAILRSRALVRRKVAISRALRSSGATCSSSPDFGVPDKPSTSTGVEGPASFIGSPCSLNKARTRPYSWPTTTISPFFSVPLCTRTVTTVPRPLSRRASITAPLAGPSVGACNSIISA